MLRFLSYHNAVPIALSIVVLSSSAAFAASSDAVYSSESEVVSVDNTYIANKDLVSYMPRLEIVSVTEDADNFYLAYRLYTIDVVDAVWRDVVKDKTLTVARGQLGKYDDLGLFATVQLKQVVDRELQYLREVQVNAQKQVTQKTVATTYSGLVGKFLDTKTEELPGYVPVVAPAPEPEPVVAVSNSASPNVQVAAAVSSGDSAPASASSSDQGSFTMQMLGDNPVRKPIGAEPYSDLGVVVTGGSGSVTLKMFVDGKETDHVVLSATYVKEWHVKYEATDSQGNIASAERLVVIYDPALEAPPAPPPVEETAVRAEAATSSPEASNPEPPAETPVEPPASTTPTDTASSTSTE